ncbi:hypothetical protein ABB37_05991 [Leptomonas pyrrhocoris]|uniref:Cytochrome b5 heme-binding domain-containing protein n=1 Tax=Leptomonas pyrrhocoris TaxID=157538 RepID=A0A0M9FZ68_LEPPY|nr:hypothetical protein ABB37_05991 [Leptomonas pyrrhocoris]KPA78927.1 hypothetical protein ABB37_05991 [Leptomonas pyrrhocoris]|eukprot:XP_015657366.1 hypothetical protein ABB37_05991 [Leptomonas pyrrhocoris]
MSDAEVYVRLFYQGMSILVPMSFVLNKHPGGAEYILQYANQNITRIFDEMNHSTGARALLKTFEEKAEDQGKEIYHAEKSKQWLKDSPIVNEEHRCLAEVSRWRQRSLLVTVATTLAAMGVAAFAFRRHLQRS